MNREEAINKLNWALDNNMIEDVQSAYDYIMAIKMAIKALEQEPCEDAISRKQAIYVASGYCHPANVARELAKLPSVNPQPCEDAISRQAALGCCRNEWEEEVEIRLKSLPPVNPQPKTGHCKDCKYFEYDSVAKVDGIPLIVAHEICSRWGDGCKTKEDGYCFLFEPHERSDTER